MPRIGGSVGTLPVARTRASYATRDPSASSTSWSSRWISTTRVSSRRSTSPHRKGQAVQRVRPLEDGGEQDPVVRRVRLVAEQRHLVLAREPVRQPRRGHAGADDHRPLMRRHRRRAQTLNSGIRLDGSSASLVSRLAPTQWNGTKTVSGRIVVDDSARRLQLAATGGRPRTGAPSTAPIRSASDGCSSTNGTGVGELADPPGLGTGLVLRQHPAGGQVQRVVVAGRLGGTDVGDRDEPGPPVRVRERVGEQPRRARVVGGRTRPEHAVLGPDPRRSRCRRSRPCRPPTRGRARRRSPPGRWRTRPASRAARPARRSRRGRSARPRAGRRPARAGSPGPRGWSWCRSPRPTA